MEPIHPNLREKWKALGVTDEEIDEYQELLGHRLAAMDTETRQFYAEKIKNCRLVKSFR